MRKICLVYFFMSLLAAPVWAQPVESGQKFHGFNLEGFTESGDKSWDIKGDTADVDGTKINLTKVNANAYGDEKVNVTAENGMINQMNGDMMLENDVIVTREDGTQLMTDKLDWSRQNDLVQTDRDIMITDDRMTLTGEGMKAQPGLSTAEIHKNVAVRVNTDKDKIKKDFVMITSDGPMTLDQGEAKAVFNDNVVAVRGDQTLKADKMEIYFDSEMNRIKDMVCIGNVVITQGENKTYAQKAVYKADEQRVVLSGRPKLIFQTEGDNAITSFGN